MGYCTKKYEAYIMFNMFYSINKEFIMKKTKEELEIDSTKREFMKKFGSYAATVPVGMYILMTPSTSAAAGSGGGSGSGAGGNNRRWK